jgi:hypothetical protein
MTNLSRQSCQIFTQENEPTQNSFQNFLQSNIGLLLDFCASKMMYGHLEILSSSFSKILGALWLYSCLENHDKLPRKTTQQSVSISVPRKDCTDLYEIRTVWPARACLSLLEICAKSTLYRMIKSISYGHN